MFVTAILAAGGRGARMGSPVPKQLLMLGDRSILQRSFDTLEAHERVDGIVVALPADMAASPPEFLRSKRKPVQVVDGGVRRQDSVANAFARIGPNLADVVIIHDAARPFASSTLFARVIDAAGSHGAAIAALRSSDTVKESAPGEGGRTVVKRTMARDAIYLAQTPQGFRYGVLEAAIAYGRDRADATDEASLAEQNGDLVQLVDGESTNIKITTEQDLHMAQALVRMGDARPGTPPVPRIGTGYDLHRLEAGRPLIIGGVTIPHAKGLVGYSDADVLCHAVTDAILGAAVLGDIGRHFPDTDPRWKGADSIALLKAAAGMVRDAGYSIVNVDAVVIAEAPKLLPFLEAIRQKLAQAMGVDVASVSVKGKTNEGVDALGRNEAIAVHAVAMLARSLEPGA
jgi:2-C-methyl-D-erythritol 4-phosphate cytidylyltransferase / 2-C-methyl-D-erythritol 2,4-cyclodiphosphate synthase